MPASRVSLGICGWRGASIRPGWCRTLCRRNRSGEITSKRPSLFHPSTGSIYARWPRSVLSTPQDTADGAISFTKLQEHLGMARLTFSRIFLVALMTAMVAFVSRRKTRSVIVDYFAAATSPLNLAVFRVAVFWTLLQSCDDSRVVWFSQIPEKLRVSPIGLEWLPEHVPIDDRWSTVACRLLEMFSFTAMIGLFSRASAALAVIFGFYALSIPEFIGKVQHGTPHLLWFGAILAVSRCGDALSCDAIMSGWRGGDRGSADLAAPSRMYALPLRFVWLLIGLIYFFPGLWKFWESGFDWALGENLRFTMYERWLQLGGWVPSFRLDLHPLLYKLSALLTMIFEVSFIWLIIFPRLRIIAVLGGLAFHQMSGVFMRIAFWGLQICYVAFLDWDAAFRRIGSWLWSERMYVVYDGNCRTCRGRIAFLRVFDLFGQVTYLNASDGEALGRHGLLWLNPEAIADDLHAIVGHRTWRGLSAYRSLVTRVPVLWPALPVLYLWSMTDLGDRIYRHAADSRPRDIADVSSKESGGVGNGARSTRVVVATSGILLLGNLVCGFAEMESSWPFTCYPTFARIRGPQMTSLTMVAVRSTGEPVSIPDKPVKRKMNAGRFDALTRHLFQTAGREELHTRITAFWRVFEREKLKPEGANVIRFYKDTLLTIPERQQENPLRRELFYELKV